MKITLLGHASVLVEMDGATCLMDPVFSDPFEEGAVTSCPRRSVFPNRLPRVDILIISHRHPDHFDLRSLALMPREADVIMPVDPLIAYALRNLDFRNIHPVQPMAPILSDRFELYPTHSAVATVQEFGMVFKDASGTFWNQVDSALVPTTIETVKQRFGAVDLLFAMYASQNFDYFDRGSVEFPYETHRRNLENVIRIDPQLVAPGAAGFRFCGTHTWLNAFLFPVSRQRFVADLERLSFRGATAIMNPGDVFSIGADEVVHHPGASDIAVLEEDDSDKIDLDPTAPIPALTDPNSDGRSKKSLRQTIDPFVNEGFAHYARAGYRTADKVVSLYRHYGASYTLSIVFPGGEIDHYRLDFDTDVVRITSGAGATPGTVVHSIAASALAAWIEHRKSFFYVRAYSRRHQAVYDIEAAADGIRLRPRALPDLLMHYLLNVAPGSALAAKHLVDRELATLSTLDEPRHRNFDA